MGNKLYVGNLPRATTEDEVRSRFEECGTVTSVKVIFDRDTGQSKGFCFVEMGSDGEAQDAIKKFDGEDCGGRPMRVNEAKPMERRSGGGDRGGNGGGGSRW